MTSEFPVTISPSAQAQLKNIIERKGEAGQFIRIGVKGGGCSGFEYVTKLDSRRLPIDLSLVLDGVEIVCDAKSAEFLMGSTLVFTGNLIGGGFQFENPNAARSCGCGTSFTPKEKTS